MQTPSQYTQTPITPEAALKELWDFLAHVPKDENTRTRLVSLIEFLNDDIAQKAAQIEKLTKPE